LPKPKLLHRFSLVLVGCQTGSDSELATCPADELLKRLLLRQAEESALELFGATVDVSDIRPRQRRQSIVESITVLRDWLRHFQQEELST
jgi:hypothetical protein